MTIEERFANYTTEEIMEGIAYLETRIAESKAAMAKNEAEGNVEMFRVAESNYNNDCAALLDAKCALAARQ